MCLLYWKIPEKVLKNSKRRLKTKKKLSWMKFALHDNDARDSTPNCHVANLNEKKSKLIYRSHPLTWKEVISCTIKC